VGLRNRLCQYFFPEVIAAALIRHKPASSGIVLMYHEVLPDNVEFSAWTIVRESDFRWQMGYLALHFDVVNMDQAMERVSAKYNAGKPFAVVTFDDGYKGVQNTVLPIMESMGIPFMLYVTTQPVLDQRPCWHDQVIGLLNAKVDVQVCLDGDVPEECFRIPCCGEANYRWKKMEHLLKRLKELAPGVREKALQTFADEYPDSGPTLEMIGMEDLKSLAASSCVTIGAHTHRHELLDQLEAHEILETLETSNNNIERIAGYSPKHFAYPNGQVNQDVLDQVGAVGYKTAVTTMSGIWSSRINRLEIPRIGIGRFETRSSFRAKVSGYL
jgi:peptidoglycan/xylan/chitin deacetylase (PgdA/CDA1 family)